MNKIFICSAIPIILIIGLLLGCKASCAPSQSDIDEMTNDLNQRFGISPNQNLIYDICDFWDNNHNTYPYLLLRYYSYGSGYVGTSLFMKNNPNVTGGNTYNIKSDCRCPVVLNNAIDVNPMAYENFYNRNSLSLQNNTYYSVTCATSQAILYSYDNFHTQDIDFSNPVYLPQLANPDVVMKFNSLNLNNDYSVPVQAEIIPTSLSNYPIYLRVQCKYYIPSLVQINFKNGISEYAPVTYGSASAFDVYSYQDYFTGNGQDPIIIDFNTANNGVALTNWESDKSSLATTFGGSNSGSTAFNQAVSDYEQYSKNAVTMGNRMECFFTFYTIIDGICYQGLTTRWYSVSPDSFDLQNNAYDVMSVIKSYTGIATNALSTLLEGSSQVPPNNPSSLSDDDVLAIAQSMLDNSDLFGLIKSENSIYENINNPNGYSTIVAYNHDNIFNMFKDYYREGTGFFTSFPSYLYYYMAWIPREVWNLVAMGFLIALVVMIVKIL